MAWYRLYKHFENCPPLWIAGGSIAEIHLIREEIKKDIVEIDMLEQKRYIIWWGYLDPVGLSTLLLKTLALIMHSYYEPGGRVIVEAMAEGVPVIATPYGFGKDYIVNWQNGFLVEYGDTNELYLRFAHFLHQPYLSDALGQNARQDARTIIKAWNFFDNHLMAYGLQSDSSIKSESIPLNYDYFKMRKTSLFPYYNLPLSKKYLMEFACRLTGESLCEYALDLDVLATSDIYRIKLSNGGIVIKQSFTRLRIGPMLNPFDKDRFVKKAEKSFRVELNAYQRSNSEVLLGYDATHYLFALKQLEPIRTIDSNSLYQCIDYIVKKVDVTSEEEKIIFNKIIRGQLCDENDVMTLYNQLEQQLPDYYFEYSGCFSEIIGWFSARFILNFNQDSFSCEIFSELQVICKHFLENTSHESDKILRSINTDVKFKHFLLNNGQMEMVDLEKSAIGSMECELAGILYDYWKTAHKDLSPNELLQFLPEKINKRKVLSYIAHSCFYDILVMTVMQRNTPEFEFKCLRALYRAIKSC